MVGFAVGLVVGVAMAAKSSGNFTKEEELTTQFVAMGISLIVNWIYSASMNSSKTQGTLGKMACGLIVTDLAGNRISFGKATGRYFATLLSAIICLIGYIMQAFNEKGQALHDTIAGTMVYKKP